MGNPMTRSRGAAAAALLFILIPQVTHAADSCEAALSACDKAIQAADLAIKNQQNVIVSQTDLILKQKERIVDLEQSESRWYNQKWFWFAAGVLTTGLIIRGTAK
jgi:hypothetical protein